MGGIHLGGYICTRRLTAELSDRRAQPEHDDASPVLRYVVIFSLQNPEFW